LVSCKVIPNGQHEPLQWYSASSLPQLPPSLTFSRLMLEVSSYVIHTYPNEPSCFILTVRTPGSHVEETMEGHAGDIPQTQKTRTISKCSIPRIRTAGAREPVSASHSHRKAKAISLPGPPRRTPQHDLRARSNRKGSYLGRTFLLRCGYH